ncbi:MAG: hypothetical protein ACTS73_04780 [Arsenophonus sp. NEOnobi-MAG3]
MSDEILEEFNVDCVLDVFLNRSSIKSLSFSDRAINSMQHLPGSIKLVSIA